MPRPYDLSSITALVCFEAAARNLSFKQAAGEMNVTPAAISHQIKALESDLGCQLFIRRSKGVELTEKGAFLFVALQRGFEAISDVVSEIRDRPEAVDVTIRATTAVSSLWLTPKISAFWKFHPAVTIAQIVSDVPAQANRCDLSIHYGNPEDDHCEYRKLFQDRIVALGTPRFMAEHAISSIRDLLKIPLIHSSGEETSLDKLARLVPVTGSPLPERSQLLRQQLHHRAAERAGRHRRGSGLGWIGRQSDAERFAGPACARKHRLTRGVSFENSPARLRKGPAVRGLAGQERLSADVSVGTLRRLCPLFSGDSSETRDYS